MRKPIFDSARSRWGRLSGPQVEGIDAILDGCAKHAFPVPWAAYALATAEHETDRTMQPIREAHGATDAQSIARLEQAWRRGQLPWVKRPYWHPDANGRAWFGRGLAQVTHAANYARVDQLLGGVGLAADPSLMLTMDVAVPALLLGMERGIYTGKKLADFAPDQYPLMRGIINGDRRKPDPANPKINMGEKIARYARAWEAGLRAAYDKGPIQ